jgi:hypothetical protein
MSVQQPYVQHGNSLAIAPTREALSDGQIALDIYKKTCLTFPQTDLEDLTDMLDN